MHKWILVVLGSWICLGSPLPAIGATFPPAVRPNTRQMFALFGFGPSILIEPGSGTQFKIAEEFGYHLDPGSGLAVGGSLEQAFSSEVFRFGVGPKVWYDIQPVPNLGLYLTPTAKLGYQVISPDAGDSLHYFNFQFGFEVRLVLGDRGLVMFRPFTLDMGGGGRSDNGFLMSYDLMFGGGAVF